MAENTSNTQQSDFLLELLTAVRRRSILALFILGATFALSMAVFAMQRPVYEASASISLGNIGLAVGKGSLIPPPEQVIASLHERYGARYHRSHAERPYLLSVDLSRKESSVIFLVARGEDANGVVDFLKTVVAKEIEDLKKRINDEIEAREQIINARRESLALLRKQLSVLHESGDRKDSLGSYILTVEKANLHQQINFLEYEVFSLEADTRLLVSDELRVLLEPTLQNGGSPIQPQLMRYLMLGGVLGIMLASLFPWLLTRLQPFMHSYQT